MLFYSPLSPLMGFSLSLSRSVSPCSFLSVSFFPSVSFFICLCLLLSEFLTLSFFLSLCLSVCLSVCSLTNYFSTLAFFSPLRRPLCISRSLSLLPPPTFSFSLLFLSMYPIWLCSYTPAAAEPLPCSVSGSLYPISTVTEALNSRSLGVISRI